MIGVLTRYTRGNVVSTAVCMCVSLLLQWKIRVGSVGEVLMLSAWRDIFTRLCPVCDIRVFHRLISLYVWCQISVHVKSLIHTHVAKCEVHMSFRKRRKGINQQQT